MVTSLVLKKFKSFAGRFLNLSWHLYLWMSCLKILLKVLPSPYYSVILKVLSIRTSILLKAQDMIDKGGPSGTHYYHPLHLYPLNSLIESSIGSTSTNKNTKIITKLPIWLSTFPTYPWWKWQQFHSYFSSFAAIPFDTNKIQTIPTAWRWHIPVGLNWYKTSQSHSNLLLHWMVWNIFHLPEIPHFGQKCWHAVNQNKQNDGDPPWSKLPTPHGPDTLLVLAMLSWNQRKFQINSNLEVVN